MRPTNAQFVEEGRQHLRERVAFNKGETRRTIEEGARPSPNREGAGMTLKSNDPCRRCKEALRKQKEATALLRAALEDLLNATSIACEDLDESDYAQVSRERAGQVLKKTASASKDTG